MTLQRHLRFAALILTTLSFGIPCGIAQNVPPPPGVIPVQVARPVEDPGPRMDFQFSGVPLVEAIKSIQAYYHRVAAPKSLNVVVGGHLRELVETNAVTLDVKQVTVGEVLNLLGMSSQRGVNWVTGQPGRLVSQGQGREGYTFIPVGSSGGNPTFLLQSDYPVGYEPLKPSLESGHGLPANVRPGEPVPSKSVAYYPLEQHLEFFTVEDITTAIKIGWELGGVKNPPTMRFHEETKLLVVAGDPEQMQYVSQVLQSLSLKRPSQPGQPSVPGRPAQRSLPVPAAKP